MHVTLSRVTNLENMSLIGKHNSNAIKANASARLEYERLKNESFLGYYQCLIFQKRHLRLCRRMQ